MPKAAANYSPYLRAILSNAIEHDQVTRDGIARAFDKSYTRGRALIEKGWRAFDQMQRALRDLPEPVGFAVLNEMVRLSSFTGLRRADAAARASQPPLRLALDGNAKYAAFMQKLATYLTDNLLCQFESADLTGVIGEIILSLQTMQGEIDRRTGKSQSQTA